MAVHFEYKGQHFELPDGTTPEVALSKIKSHLGEEVAQPEDAHAKLKADIESIPGVPEQPTPAPEPSVLEKAHAGIEAAGNIVSSAAWGVGALPYGLIKSAFTDKTKEQEAEEAMAANPLISKGELTQEYTRKAGEALATVAAPVLPELGAIGRTPIIRGKKGALAKEEVVPEKPVAKVEEPTAPKVPEEEVVQQRDVYEDAAVKAQEEVKPSLPPEVENNYTPEANKTVIEKTLDLPLIKQGAELLDAGVGTLSTRIHNVNPEVGLRAIETEMNIKRNTHTAIDKSQEALKFLEKGTPKLGERLLAKTGLYDISQKQSRVDVIKNEFLNNDRAALLKRAAESGEKEVAELKTFYAELDKVGKELSDRGIITPRENYLPRMVKDREGLLNSLGYKLKGDFVLALEAEAKKQGIPISALDDLSFSQVANKYVTRSQVAGMGKAGLTKGRVFKEITPEMQKFYYDPVETAHTYFERAYTELHKSDFFGKSSIIKEGRVDVDSSIGAYLGNLVQEGKLEIGSPKWEELKTVLELRWKYGHMMPKALVQDIRNIGTVGLLANAISAIKNTSDFLWTPTIYGIRPAVMAAVQGITNKVPMRTKDFGLADHLSEEFIGKSSTQRLTDEAMKLSFWKVLDPLGKTFQFSSSLNRARIWAGSPKGVKQLEARYKDVFGSDYPQLVKDLQAGENTHLTQLMSFWEVSQHQPLTKLQKTEFQVKHPNTGTLTHQLKSFMIMQADFARRNAYNEIKKGNTAKGMEMLTRIGVAWASVGVAQKAISNFILGRDEDIEGSDIVAGALSQVGFNTYAWDEMKKGNIARGIAMQVMPPAFSVADIAAKQPERLVPVLGPVIAEEAKSEKKRKKELEKAIK